MELTRLTLVRQAPIKIQPRYASGNSYQGEWQEDSFNFSHWNLTNILNISISTLLKTTAGPLLRSGGFVSLAAVNYCRYQWLAVIA
jgi:hypothetical protein